MCLRSSNLRRKQSVGMRTKAQQKDLVSVNMVSIPGEMRYFFRTRLHPRKRIIRRRWSSCWSRIRYVGQTSRAAQTRMDRADLRRIAFYQIRRHPPTTAERSGNVIIIDHDLLRRTLSVRNHVDHFLTDCPLGNI
jgi:hypothetical protein